jgi:hypothetical protein
MNLKRVFKEPLVHFLAAGGILFLIFRFTNPVVPDLPSDKTITVDRQGLLNFLQYRAKAFQPEYFAKEFDAMSAEERKALVDQYVEEEMLYREARALQLEQGDYVIRQRLVQKMRYLIDDLTEGGSAPDDATLNQYLQKNSEVYTVAPSVTFTHVFLDSSRHGDSEAKTMAEKVQRELLSHAAGFNDAPRFGDRFPYLQNYVERTFDYVGSHFGDEFVSALKEMAPSQSWSGPIHSIHGYHLVLLTARAEARMPELGEIRTQLEEDWKRDRAEAARSFSMSRLAREYTIRQKDLVADRKK